MATDRGGVYHNLSVLMSAAVPIFQTLDNVAKNTGGKFGRVFRGIAAYVRQGDRLSQAMSRYPKVFPELDIVLVNAGEESGNLAEVMGFLSRWYDFVKRIRRIILSGMVLPVFLIHITAFLAPVPELVLSTISKHQYLIQAAWTLSYLYIPVLAILCILRFTPRKGPLRFLLDTFILVTPVLGRAVRHLALSRFCRSFVMLYKAGIPIIQCAESAIDVTGNLVVARQLKGGLASGRTGHPISEGFSRTLPNDFLSIWQVGEDTGKLDEAVERLAEEYATSAEMLFEELARWLPRLIYFLICGMMAMKIMGGYGAIYDANTFH
ncbi:MAG: type II secretion system F family protein [Planctomycetes bacterium]|nr:type II secretion system F family protein [Planctomycetota bacterium]